MVRICPMTRISILVVALLASLFATVAYAQTGTPTAYVFRIYPAGSSTPLGGPLTVPAANTPCDLAPATGSNVNPTRWRWADPARPGRECEFPDSARLAALADGDYSGTVAASNADGTSTESTPYPFVRRRPNPPNVPTGVKVIP